MPVEESHGHDEAGHVHPHDHEGHDHHDHGGHVHAHDEAHDHGTHGHVHGADELPGPLLGGIAFASEAAREHARAHALGLPHVHPVNFDPTVPEPDPFLPQAGHGHAFRLGIGGPVGSGKTALTAALCRALAGETNLAVVTNDIYTTEDADFLKRNSVLADERIEAVQTGTCPHTAIRDDITANLDKCDLLEARIPGLELIIIESGGDNLTAVFSRGLIDAQIFVVDVAAGDKIPRKGGPGVTTADLLVINKTDLAPYVGADLGVMESDAHLMRDDRPVVLQSLVETPDAPAVADWLRATMREHAAAAGSAGSDAAAASPAR